MARTWNAETAITFYRYLLRNSKDESLRAGSNEFNIYL